MRERETESERKTERQRDRVCERETQREREREGERKKTLRHPGSQRVFGTCKTVRTRFWSWC